MRIVLTVLNVVLAVTYPLAIWWSLSRFSPRVVGLIGIALLVPVLVLRFHRAASDPERRGHLLAVLRVPLSILALLLLGAVLDDQRLILAMPVLISGVLLVTFGASLRQEMSLIERFARMKEKELTPAQVAHCRQFTWVWCGFFVVNGGIAAFLALLEDTFAWAAYTSGIAYALMGVLFVGEFIVRRYRFRDYGRGPHDRLLSRVFPGPAKQP
ncbi:MAG: hypothetical protein AAGF12_32955 [Myxococcota bacterium]